MRAFAELYDEIDTTTSTNLKVAAMARLFRQRCRRRMPRGPLTFSRAAG